MAKKKTQTKSKKSRQRTPVKKPNRTVKSAEPRAQAIRPPKDSPSSPSSLHVAVHSQPAPDVPSRPVFSIEIGSIGGETTIGDLIVAFPRTRDVLMKHGLRFDVEEAGYLYMTLNVFSAIHGLTTNSLVQELHTASREPPPQPAVPSLRPLTTAPTA
jgi:hypothetical protein